MFPRDGERRAFGGTGQIFRQGDEHKATVELGSTIEGQDHLEEWRNHFS